MGELRQRGGERSEGNEVDAGTRELNVPALQQLGPVNFFAIKQDVEAFEAITGIETSNSYQVVAIKDSRVLFGPLAAQESSNFLARQCCGNRRPWTIRIGGQAMLLFERPFRILKMPEVQVYSSTDTTRLGSVRRQWRGWPFQRNFLLMNHNDEPVLELTCPFLSWGHNFTLRDLDGNELGSGAELGSISKTWPQNLKDVLRECFTDADNFIAAFPEDLPTQFKALVLGAVFLIDFCFFEDNEVQRKARERRGRR
mmetsp:Transcript_157742/g.483410  ORF Transcript_157742/g.483410 Transcript_157742/m.483410 type:complete len:255 (+) Transcript_157742:93-857(+)